MYENVLNKGIILKLLGSKKSILVFLKHEWFVVSLLRYDYQKILIYIKDSFGLKNRAASYIAIVIWRSYSDVWYGDRNGSKQTVYYKN